MADFLPSQASKSRPPRSSVGPSGTHPAQGLPPQSRGDLPQPRGQRGGAPWGILLQQLRELRHLSQHHAATGRSPCLPGVGPEISLVLAQVFFGVVRLISFLEDGYLTKYGQLDDGGNLSVGSWGGGFGRAV